jgi:hypothetical protein
VSRWFPEPVPLWRTIPLILEATFLGVLSIVRLSDGAPLWAKAGVLIAALELLMALPQLVRTLRLRGQDSREYNDIL